MYNKPKRRRIPSRSTTTSWNEVRETDKIIVLQLIQVFEMLDYNHPKKKRVNYERYNL